MYEVVSENIFAIIAQQENDTTKIKGLQPAVLSVNTV